MTICYELNRDYRAALHASGLATCEAYNQELAESLGSERNIWLGEFSPRRAMVAAAVFVTALLIVVPPHRGSQDLASVPLEVEAR